MLRKWIEELVHPRCYTLAESLKLEQNKPYYAPYEALVKVELNIKSFDGYQLHGTFIQNQNKLVIISHGYAYNRHGSIKYAMLFYALGYSVYLYDLRHHGENEPSFISMGKNEVGDLKSIVEFFQQSYHFDEIGLHGESLGASVSIMTLPQLSGINWLVADCGFSDLNELLKYKLHQRHPNYPNWIVWLGSMWCKRHYGFSFRQISPISLLKQTKIPILFIHGQNDQFTPMEMTKAMYEQYQGTKELMLVPGAGHAQCYRINSISYQETINNFIQNLTT